MYYFAGIFDLKKEKNTEKIFLNMFSGENKKNCYIFYDQFFYLGYKLPNNKYSCLDVPRFFRPSKNISIVIEGNVDNLNNFCCKKGGLGDVFLELYNRFGISFLKELSGNFSFVLYDAKKEKIFLYRSKVGLKPLYYSMVDTKTVNFKTISRKNEDYNRAKKRAADYGINHKVVIFKPKQFLKILSEVVPKLDRLANINILNSLIIFRLISEGGDIIFSGDGAEEQLGFYNYHGFAYNFDRMVKNLPLSDTRDIYQNSLLVIYNSIFCRSWEWKNNVSPKAYFTDLFSNDFNKKINNANLYGYFLRCIDRTIDSSTTVNTPSQFPSLFNKILSLDFINNIVPNKFMLSDITSRLYSVKISLPFASENLVHFLFRIPAFLKTRNDNYANSKYK